MDESKGKGKNNVKLSSRVSWTYDESLPEGELLEHINAMPVPQRYELFSALMAFYYGEVAFLNDNLEGYRLRRVQSLILQLEKRAAYLRELANLPALEVAVVTTSKSAVEVSSNLDSNFTADIATIEKEIDTLLPSNLSPGSSIVPQVSPIFQADEEDLDEDDDEEMGEMPDFFNDGL